MKEEVIAIDGKTLRHSYDASKDKSAIHMVRQRCRRVSLRRRLRTRRVSAWATQNRLVLGLVLVDDKSNEITAIPKLAQGFVTKRLYCDDRCYGVSAGNCQADKRGRRRLRYHFEEESRWVV